MEMWPAAMNAFEIMDQFPLSNDYGGRDLLSQWKSLNDRNKDEKSPNK